MVRIARSSTVLSTQRDVLTPVRHVSQPRDLNESPVEQHACPVCGAHSGQPCVSDKAAGGIQIGAIAHAGRFVAR
jgi:hypothetical protein